MRDGGGHYLRPERGVMQDSEDGDSGDGEDAPFAWAGQ